VQLSSVKSLGLTPRALLQVEEDTFSVYLIPETMRVTVFGSKEQGDSVNIEIETNTQAIVDTVERVVEARMKGILKKSSAE
jgi:riboflavin synthase alpha subunit